MTFKQAIPSIQLSVEMGTASVPQDGRYHLVRDGELIASFASKPSALKAYTAARNELLAASEVSTQDPAIAAAALKRRLAEVDYRDYRGSATGWRYRLGVVARRGHR